MDQADADFVDVDVAEFAHGLAQHLADLVCRQTHPAPVDVVRQAFEALYANPKTMGLDDDAAPKLVLIGITQIR